VATNHPATPLLSNLIQIACPVLAGFACLSASRREKFFKHFWLLFGTGVFSWAIAQTVATYYGSGAVAQRHHLFSRHVGAADDSFH
jgi:hypothetical protein